MGFDLRIFEGGNKKNGAIKMKMNRLEYEKCRMNMTEALNQMSEPHTKYVLE